MNIIDTRSNIAFSNHKKGSIKNIPLFELKSFEYALPSKDFTDIIFQSIPSIEFFKEKDRLINKDIYTMGPSTKNFLLQKGFDSICPTFPGSKELIKLLPNLNNNKFLIVRGNDGLSDIFDYLYKNKNKVSGKIKLKLFKGNIIILSRVATNKAYSLKKVSFEENRSFNKNSVERFIKFHKTKLYK